MMCMRFTVVVPHSPLPGPDPIPAGKGGWSRLMLVPASQDTGFRNPLAARVRANNGPTNENGGGEGMHRCAMAGAVKQVRYGGRQAQQGSCCRRIQPWRQRPVTVSGGPTAAESLRPSSTYGSSNRLGFSVHPDLAHRDMGVDAPGGPIEGT